MRPADGVLEGSGGVDATVGTAAAEGEEKVMRVARDLAAARAAEEAAEEGRPRDGEGSDA
jgi:hypothetical protein